MNFAYLVSGLPEVYPQISLEKEDKTYGSLGGIFLTSIKWLNAHRPFQR
ncbi:hypothetical protein ACO0K0_17480 [Undibacterium sp. SXout11W]